MQSIKGITEIITKPGLVNVDFNDIMTIMKNGGVAMIGIGESKSEDGRIDEAVNEALSSPLLGDLDTREARGALIRVVGGNDMTLAEAEKAAEIVGRSINPMSRIIWAAHRAELEGIVKVPCRHHRREVEPILGRENIDRAKSTECGDLSDVVKDRRAAEIIAFRVHSRSPLSTSDFWTR